MPLDPIYLVIHSGSLTSDPKPYFRIVAVEQTNLPSRFTSYDDEKYKYINVLVTTSQVPIVGEWRIKIECSKLAGHEVCVLGWYISLEAAGKNLADDVASEVENEVVKGNAYHQKDGVTGNPEVYYVAQEQKEDEVGLLETTELHYWWEIIKVKLVWGDVYGVQFNAEAREMYAANAANIAHLDVKERTWGLSGEEKTQLEQLRKKVGFVNLERDEFERVVGGELESLGVRLIMGLEEV